MKRMQTSAFDCAVIGAGLVGLSTARAVQRRFPGARVLVLEKEERVAMHQSGRNSGVLHSGVYYPPGSLKARLTAAGRSAMLQFCEEHRVAHELCGKVVLANWEGHLSRLAALAQRGKANGLQVELIDAQQLRGHEPHAQALQALWVPEAGVVDFPAVAGMLAKQIVASGGEVHLGARVRGLAFAHGVHQIRTHQGLVVAKFLVNCAGLFSDRLARRAGLDPELRIVPFRGEYFRLKGRARDKVRGLIYPLPDPDFPFLGVHLTRMTTGEVLAGPNAVLAFAREGYTAGDFNLGELSETISYPGFLRLARANLGHGLREMLRAGSRQRFAQALQRLVPSLIAEDLEPARTGVRAQAVDHDGSLVDDFRFVQGEQAVHVVNAPSPAATASLAIGDYVAEGIEL